MKGYQYSWYYSAHSKVYLIHVMNPKTYILFGMSRDHYGVATARKFAPVSQQELHHYKDENNENNVGKGPGWNRDSTGEDFIISNINFVLQ